MEEFVKGADAYIIENTLKIRPVTVVSVYGGLYTLKFKDGPGGTRLKKNRLYRTLEDAESSKEFRSEQKTGHFRDPHSFGYY